MSSTATSATVKNESHYFIMTHYNIAIQSNNHRINLQDPLDRPPLSPTASSCSCETCSCDSDCTSCCSSDDIESPTYNARENVGSGIIDTNKALEVQGGDKYDTWPRDYDRELHQTIVTQHPQVKVNSNTLQKELNEIQELLGDVKIDGNDDLTFTPYASTIGKYSMGFDYSTTNDNSPSFMDVNHPFSRGNCDFNTQDWHLNNDDGDYSVHGLYTKLVSLDLLTYMHIIEHVLDECVRNEIESK